ncbi:hypothetical protein GCM10020369_14410 [Cryptosporangium minutisporangium]|uniref:Uncharacterized protein n=1 Tax=Cryptosporangium minutisporangium TaxID=113569 RepID=A0ABP6SSK5_9ACTN
MNEFSDPGAWRTRSRIPRASGAWVGVARVQTASRAERPSSDRALTEEAWTGGSWNDDARADDAPAAEHVDAGAWAASMLAAEARRADAPRGRHGAHLARQHTTPEPATAEPAAAAPWSDDAPWPDEAQLDAGWATDAAAPPVGAPEYSARRTPLSSGDGGRHRAPRALRLVYSADSAEPVEPAERSEGETYEGPVNRPGGHSGTSLPAPTEETTPA